MLTAPDICSGFSRTPASILHTTGADEETRAHTHMTTHLPEDLALTMPYDTTSDALKFQWTIAFPDMGAYMRYNHMFTAYDTIICMKVRQVPIL